MREWFKDTNFKPDTQALIVLANRILAEYAAQGFRLTLRQLFYQLVARGHIPNTQRMYKNLGTHIGNARLAGLIDWAMIEDRARSTDWPAHWEDPAEMVKAAAEQYRIDKWADQPNHVEVMVEKDALSGVLQPVCRDLDVRFTANRGYSSLSHFYRIGKRLEGEMNEGKEVHVLYLGDHDPSGLDMDRDIADRLELFSGYEFDYSFYVNRLALTMDQVDEYDPPPNPAKLSDSRARGYIDLFGPTSWELDALDPTTLANLVTDAVEDLRDEDLWTEAVAREEEQREELTKFVDDYGKD